MSRKSHPIGLRLGQTQTWQSSVNFFNYSFSHQREFFIWRWFTGFCKVNHYYLFDFLKLHESRVFVFFSCFFFGDPLRQKKPRPWKVLLYGVKYYYRSKRSRMKKVKLFYQKFLRHYWFFLFFAKAGRHFKQKVQKGKRLRDFSATSFLFCPYLLRGRMLHGVANSVSTQLLRLQNGPSSPFIAYQIKKKVLSTLYKKKIRSQRLSISSSLLRTLHSRFYLLRLKNFLERRISSYLLKHTIILFQNLHEAFLLKQKKVIQRRNHFGGYRAPNFRNSTQRTMTFITTRSDDWRTINKQIYSIFRELKSQFFFTFPPHFVTLAYFGCLYKKPAVILQWLVYTLSLVRKHSLTLTHHKLLGLFTTCLEYLVHLVGFLLGFRCEVTGKIGGSERTKKFLVVSGVPIARQKSEERFKYHFEHIPTYAGALGIRLWLKY